MKSIVIYGSKYGSSKKYANWIGEELNCSVISYKEVNKAKLKDYDTIVFGGGLYAGGITGLTFIKKNFQLFKNKKLAIYTCGLADVTKEENLKGIRMALDNMFSEEEKKSIGFFHFRGGIDYSKLSFIHRIMMKMMYKHISKIKDEDRTQENIEFIESYGKAIDFTDKRYIGQLIKYICN